MDNNRSERALRSVAIGRKAWLFCGSDDHAQSAANLMTLVASAKLHGLDPEAYMRDILRVVPFWPRERFLELAPKHCAATRAALDPRQLDAEIGELTAPTPEETLA
jgi:transposase